MYERAYIHACTHLFSCSDGCACRWCVSSGRGCRARASLWASWAPRRIASRSRSSVQVRICHHMHKCTHAHSCARANMLKYKLSSQWYLRVSRACEWGVVAYRKYFAHTYRFVYFNPSCCVPGCIYFSLLIFSFYVLFLEPPMHIFLSFLHLVSISFFPLTYSFSSFLLS